MWATQGRTLSLCCFLHFRHMSLWRAQSSQAAWHFHLVAGRHFWDRGEMWSRLAVARNERERKELRYISGCCYGSRGGRPFTSIISNLTAALTGKCSCLYVRNQEITVFFMYSTCQGHSFASKAHSSGQDHSFVLKAHIAQFIARYIWRLQLTEESWETQKRRTQLLLLPILYGLPVWCTSLDSLGAGNLMWAG